MGDDAGSIERRALDRVNSLVDQADASGYSADVEPVRRLDEDLDRRERSQLLDLKDKYAGWLLWLLTAQMVITNGAFVAFAWVGWDWRVPDGVMLGWLSATVVELVGVVLVVVHHLFPSRDGR